MEKHDSSDRQPGAYVLFALGAGGLLTAAAGIIITSPGLAILGTLMMLIIIFFFRLGAPLD